MKTRILILVLLLAVGWLVIGKFRGSDQSSSSASSASSAEQTKARPQTVNVSDVLAYETLNATTFRVRTTRDVLPGGFSAAMAPMLIDWDRSDLSPGGFVILRNINDGGNPVSGVTTLRTARVHFERVKTAEFILVPLGGPDAVSHGQLRFVFEPGSAEFLDADMAAVGESDVLEDLVLSWEAWRPPGVDYDVLQGMNRENYELSLRAYSGHQRFLEDALGARDWNVFTLQLPGGQRGLTELLKVALALGDGAARESIGRMLDQAEEAWVQAGPDSEEEGGNAIEQWRTIRDHLDAAGAPDSDTRIDMKGWTGYQTLIRSCATMALYSVNVAVARLIEKGLPHEGMRPTETPEFQEEPKWMTELADANIAGIFARAPQAVRYARSNPTVIPSKIPGLLDAAGLLVREGEKPQKHHFTMDGETPWGHRDQLLIR